MLPIVPRCKLLINYDIKPKLHRSYTRYMLTEFVPEAKEMGLHIFMIWQVVYGDYPARQLVLVADSIEAAQSALASERWKQLEERMKTYISTSTYSTKLLPYHDRFQF